MGWLSGWSYRKSHVVNPASGAGTNYQIKIKAHYGSGTDSGEDVYLNSHCRSDFGDVRFTDDDGTTLLDYWMESKVDSDYAIFWVKVADDLSSNSATIYVYYGKSDATTTSNGANTFIFFDDFSGDLNKWTKIEGNNPTIEDGQMKMTQSGATWGAVRSNDLLVCSSRLKYKLKKSVTNQPARSGRTNAYSTSTHLPYGDDAIMIEMWSDDKYYTETCNEATKTEKTGGTYDTNYHTYEILTVAGSSGKHYKDDVLITSEHTTNVPDGTMYIFFQVYSGTIYVDDVRLGKYVSPEPSHGSWGSEETSGGITYEIYVDATSQSLATPAYETTYNISKDSSVTSQSMHTPETTFNIAEDAVTHAIASAVIEVVIGIIEIFKEAVATTQATFILESAFNISQDAIARASAIVNTETIFNLVKDAVIHASVFPQILGIYPITPAAPVNTSAAPNLQQILGISRDAVVVTVSTPLIQSAFNISPEATVKVLAEVAIAKEGEIKVTKLFLIFGDLAIQIQGG
jgi:hypothetical protein